MSMGHAGGNNPYSYYYSNQYYMQQQQQNQQYANYANAYSGNNTQENQQSQQKPQKNYVQQPQALKSAVMTQNTPLYSAPVSITSADASGNKGVASSSSSSKQDGEVKQEKGENPAKGLMEEGQAARVEVMDDSKEPKVLPAEDAGAKQSNPGKSDAQTAIGAVLMAVGIIMSMDMIALALQAVGMILTVTGTALHAAGTAMAAAGMALISSGQALLSNPFTAAAGAALIAAGTALKIAGTVMKVTGKVMKAIGKVMHKVAKAIQKALKALMRGVKKLLGRAMNKFRSGKMAKMIKANRAMKAKHGTKFSKMAKAKGAKGAKARKEYVKGLDPAKRADFAKYQQNQLKINQYAAKGARPPKSVTGVSKTTNTATNAGKTTAVKSTKATTQSTKQSFTQSAKQSMSKAKDSLKQAPGKAKDATLRRLNGFKKQAAKTPRPSFKNSPSKAWSNAKEAGKNSWAKHTTRTNPKAGQATGKFSHAGDKISQSYKGFKKDFSQAIHKTPKSGAGKAGKAGTAGKAAKPSLDKGKLVRWAGGGVAIGFGAHTVHKAQNPDNPYEGPAYERYERFKTWDEFNKHYGYDKPLEIPDYQSGYTQHYNHRQAGINRAGANNSSQSPNTQYNPYNYNTTGDYYGTNPGYNPYQNSGYGYYSSGYGKGAGAGGYTTNNGRAIGGYDNNNTKLRLVNNPKDDKTKTNTSDNKIRLINEAGTGNNTEKNRFKSTGNGYSKQNTGNPKKQAVNSNQKWPNGNNIYLYNNPRNNPRTANNSNYSYSFAQDYGYG